MAVRLVINGKQVELASEMPLPALLAERQIDVRHIAVAVNGDVVERMSYDTVILRGGDVVEIVRMVGGG
jgi:thiamine biosynthesis protein ThiS